MPINVSSGSIQNQTVSGIDTGTGGFTVDGDNFAHTYDVGDVDSPGTSQLPWSPGDINVDKTKKDLSNNTKATLADYLGRSTAASKNTYQLNTTLKVDLALTDQNGYPQRPGSIPDSQPHFTDVEPGRSTAATSLNILRGKEPPVAGAVDGNRLLNVGPTGQPSEPAKDYYSKVISSNRFGTDNTYENNSGLNAAQFAKKYPMGVSLPAEDPSRNLTFGRLAQVGNVLSLRASQEAGSFRDEFTPTDESAIAAALLPGASQLGVDKLNADQLTAASVIEHLTKNEIEGDLLTDPAGKSWGSLNNVQDEFSGLSAFGMQLLAVALIIALTIIMSTMSVLLMIPGMNDTKNSRDLKDVRRPLGAYHYDSAIQGQSIAAIIASGGSFNFWRMIGVETTENEVAKCLPIGVLAFFGVDTGTSAATPPDRTTPPANLSGAEIASSALRGLVSVTESPGYYTVVARNVSRSFSQLSAAFKAVGNVTGFASGAKQVLSVIETLRSSKFVRILNVFAHLGDQILQERAAVDKTSEGSGLRYLSDIDEAEDFEGGKSRIKHPDIGAVSLQLSWSSRMSGAHFLMPNAINNYISNAPALNSDIPNLQKKNITSWKNAETRISGTDRADLESKLSSKYVPFYLHDVRTNEIVSFHAFLASLSDDYTANYDSVDAIGRVETIKIYKSTNRKIGFSFFIVATSPDDFDDVWLKINKLTTLVYPQFSQGRKISVSKDGTENNFTMPFSQTIQASPLVRVRIGDLLTSNYTDFNMSRLFGADSPEFKIEGVTVSDISVDKQQQDAAIAATSNQSKPGAAKFETDYTYEPADKSNLKDFKDAPNTGWPSGLVLVYKKTAEGSDKAIFAIEAVKVSDAENYGLNEAACKAAPDTYQKFIQSNQSITLNKSLVKETEVTKDKIKKKTEEIAAAAKQQANEDEKKRKDDYAKKEEKIKNFLTDNAITKSFKSSGGQGLAGFIDSMSFDWYDGVTWTTDEGEGRKAPKMCKVTVSFTPIHDITPGLDHNGFNRAPIYNIGPKTKKS